MGGRGEIGVLVDDRIRSYFDLRVGRLVDEAFFSTLERSEVQEAA